MKKYVCTVCGYIAEGSIPEQCPVCKAPASAFVEKAGNTYVTEHVVGIAKDEDGVWYWRQTSDNGETYEWILVDGEKVPAGGEKPEDGIDAEGF